ncbi:MAG: ArsR/SmtB family transcription factor [Candidatus Hodarchaeales archaeon]
MNEELSDKEVQNFLLESLNKISIALKATAHSKRLKVLALLIDQPETFSNLRRKTSIESKTVLAHHLGLLVNSNLVERKERGMYDITPEGRELLKAAVDVYYGTTSSTNEKRQLSRKQVIVKNIVSVDPIYQPGWNSYVSSVSGVLIPLGINYDHVYVGGRCGYSFIVQVVKGRTSFLGGSILSKNAWKDIYSGTESFGWKINEWIAERAYPDMWDLSGEDYVKAREMFNNIKKIIDEQDTPIILWGLRVPTFGIVKGYDDDSYVVSSHYRREGRVDTPVRFDSLNAIEELKFFYFVEEKPILHEEIEDKESLSRAIKMAKGIEVAPEGYVAGPEAYKEWAEILENGDTSQINTFGNSYLGRRYHDAKVVVTEYLERLSRKYASFPHTDVLRDASYEYRRTKNVLEKFIMIFPYYEQRKIKMTVDNRKIGANLLLKAREYELKAIKNMEKANKEWASIK